jgi:AraC-like DNA-binding protein
VGCVEKRGVRGAAGLSAQRGRWQRGVDCACPMLFLKHSPAAPVGEFVEYLWLLRDAPAHGRERIFPTGALELVINLDEDEVRIYDCAGVCRRFSGIVLSGAYERPFVIDTAEHAFAMGVHFRCGGAFPFTRGIAPGELAGHVDLGMLWGTGAFDLREQLCAARSHSARFRILERALLEALEKRRVDARMQWAASRLSTGTERVRDVVASSGLSHRYFVSLFRDTVGMTPKLFSRVQRFQRALEAFQKPASASWARVASDSGYYDQAHLIRDFAEFAACTPSQYVEGRTDCVKDHHWVVPSREPG